MTHRSTGLDYSSDEFRKGRELSIERRDAWEWVYDLLCEIRKDQAQASAPPRREGVLGSSAFDIGRLTAGVENPAWATTRYAITSQHDIAFVERLQRQVDEATADTRALAEERRLAQETYDSTRQPEGFSLALQVLSVLAAAGLGYPVILMGVGTQTFNIGVRVSAIAAAFAGIALLLRFLFVYASFLREGGRETLPRTVFGLFGRG